MNQDLPDQLADGFSSIHDALQQQWPALSDEDITRAHGSVLRLIGTIEEHSGQLHWEIQAQLQRIFARHGLASSANAHAAEGHVPT